MTTAKPVPQAPSSAAEELKAMTKITRMLDDVDRATADRVVGWLYDRYSIGGQETDPEGAP